MVSRTLLSLFEIPPAPHSQVVCLFQHHFVWAPLLCQKPHHFFQDSFAAAECLPLLRMVSWSPAAMSHNCLQDGEYKIFNLVLEALIHFNCKVMGNQMRTFVPVLEVILSGNPLSFDFILFVCDSSSIATSF